MYVFYNRDGSEVTGMQHLKYIKRLIGILNKQSDLWLQVDRDMSNSAANQLYKLFEIEDSFTYKQFTKDGPYCYCGDRLYGYQ